MQLSEKDIEDLILKPKNREKLIEAMQHQKRLVMHVDGIGIESVLNKVEPLLTESKLTNFRHLLRAWSKPLFDELSSSLFKIHNAKGRVSKWEFKDGEKETIETFYEIVNKSFYNRSPNYFFSNKGFKLLLSAPNTVLLTDMPQIQTDENGMLRVVNPVTGKTKLFEITEPYNVCVGLESQHDICIKGGQVQYLIIRTEIKTEKGKIEKFFIVDSEKYVTAIKEGETINIINSNPHNLGYCPAVTISQTDRFTHCEIAKKSPFSDALDLADDYIITKTAVKNSQMRTAYKKEWEIETRQHCGSSSCNNGFVYDEITGENIACGSCEKLKKRNKSAFGRLITIPNPDNLSENAVRIYTNPVGENNSDVALLNYQLEVLKGIEEKIKDTCLGDGFAQDNPNVSKNQMQVMSNYDSIESVLNFWSNDIASVWKFLNDTIARLSFGNEFENSSFSLGNKFFLKTEEQIELTEKIARENGAPNYILEALRLEKVATKYKNNPESAKRSMILEQLEPLKEYNTEQITNFLSSGIISRNEMLLKVNFIKYINRYEREFGVIRVINNDFNTTVKLIENQLNIYINEEEKNDNSNL